MSTVDIPSYLFKTKEQWASGLLARSLVGDDGSIAPLQPFAHSARKYASQGARVPAFDRAGDLYWLDDSASLYLLPAIPMGTDDETPKKLPLPGDVTNTPRIVAGRMYLWAVGHTRRSLLQYELSSLQSIQSVPVSGEVVDIADDRRDGVWALVRQNETYELIHFDCAGQRVETLAVKVCEPFSFAYLKGASVFVLLACGGRAVAFLSTDGNLIGEAQTLDSLAPCFAATLLAGDGDDRISLSGPDPWNTGQFLLFVLDGNGEALDQQILSYSPCGIALNAEGLVVASATGINYYEAEPDDRGAEASCVFLTPVLHSPDNSVENGWLRAEILGSLGQGASLSVEYASTADERIVQQAVRIAANESLPANLRQARIASLLDGEWSEPALIPGDDASDDPVAERTYATPLFGAQEPYLWLRLTLVAAAGAHMPRVSALRVLYPNRSLQRNLPPIYSTGENATDFTRRLLGVLETTTQGLDATISSLGSLVHPSSAPPDWLDVIARWLGLPWDDEIDESYKRRLLSAAPQILAARGTRAALEALLDAVLPGSPRRYVVIDYTAQYDVPRLGGGRSPGARLPLLIGGLPSTAATLGRRAILGRARLCPNSPCADPMLGLTGRIDVAVTATAIERPAYEPWLESLLMALLPVTCRLVLRWRTSRPADWAGVLDSNLELRATPTSSLGKEALLGHTRLPVNRPPTLTKDGPDLGTSSMS
jgi:phage tail-like protein